MATQALESSITSRIARICNNHTDNISFYVRELLPSVQLNSDDLSELEICERLMGFDEITQFYVPEVWR